MTEKPEWWTSDEWSTPFDVFARIAARFGPFDLDACARPETAKAPRYFVAGEDGLLQPWRAMAVWVNPPYSEPRRWCEKAQREVEQGNAGRVVMLLPAAVDTHWFHETVVPFADVVFVRGRVKFIGWQGTPIGSPKSGNVLAIYPKRSNVFALNERHCEPEAVGAVDPQACSTGKPSTRDSKNSHNAPTPSQGGATHE